MSRPVPCPECGAPTIEVRVDVPGFGRQTVVCDGPWPMIKIDQLPHAIGPKTGRIVTVFNPHEVSCLGGQDAAQVGQLEESHQ